MMVMDEKQRQLQQALVVRRAKNNFQGKWQGAGRMTLIYLVISLGR